MQRSSIADLVRRGAGLYGDRVAVVSDGTAYTYAEVDERSTRLANALVEADLEPGDRVATVMYNDIAHISVFVAAAKAGLVLVPVNRRLSGPELRKVFAGAEPRMVIHDAALAERAGVGAADTGAVLVTTDPAGDRSLDELVERGSPTDPGGGGAGEQLQAVYYTSGSTGTPKGVARSHASNMFMAWGFLAMMPVEPDDTLLYAFPMTSSAFYGLAVPAWMVGARMVVHREFDARRILRALADDEVTHTTMAPTMWELLMGEPDHRSVRPGRLRYASWGGSPVRRGTLDRLTEWLPVPVGGAYGLTEATCVTACVGENARQAPSSCGVPTPATAVRIVGPDRRQLPPGELGEVELQSLICADGYYRDPEQTARSFVDGWFRTGDVGRMDADGRLYVVDRAKDLIISGGENIYPGEVENVITPMPGVQEVCVVGVPDEKWGETVCAFIAPRPGADITADDVLDRCRRQLAGFKRPRHVRFLPELPKNSMGKFVKRRLVDEWCREEEQHARA